ncbi:MAG: hypothetical protein LBE12_14470 [Planctomycetaceae bacterium]|nr:hypothetical protein [Planctomycetaceae bacterium]
MIVDSIASGIIANPLATTLHSPLSTLNYYLALAGLWENVGVPAPAVALRFTAGYAFHTPSGVKIKKQKFH